MSIKDLFEKGKTFQHSSLKNAEEIGKEVESTGYVERRLQDEERFVPQVDFNDPASFARYGSAEKYYKDSFERILQTYPYDGSKKEKLEWKLSSSHIDNYIFENVYPRTTGYAIFAPGGWGSLATALVVAPGAGWAEGYGSPSDQEFIEVKSYAA